MTRKALPSVVKPKSVTAGRAGSRSPARAAPSFSSAGAFCTSSGGEVTVISLTATAWPVRLSIARRTVPPRVDRRIFSNV